MKNSTLYFGTTCSDCARGLLFDGDLGGVCPVCTRFAPAPADPFIALVGVELVESADTLDELLAGLREILDDTGNEDVAVWQGQRILLVLHADGRVSDFGGPR